MAATANKVLKRAEGLRGGGPVAASTRLYEATLAFFNAGGYAVGIVAAGVNKFAGVVIQEVDNSAGSNGTLNAEWFTDGVFPMVGTGFSQATVGSDVFATDNYTVQTSGVSASYVGRCVGYVSSTVIMVEIKRNGPTVQDVLTNKTLSTGTLDFRPALTVTPAADSAAGSLITAGVTQVDVAAVTNDADDFVVLPAIAAVAIGHTIRIACNAGTNFELRTPATSGTKINDQDCDGTKEYLCTDTDMVVVTKHTTTGWIAQSLTKLGAVRAAVVPD